MNDSTPNWQLPPPVIPPPPVRPRQPKGPWILAGAALAVSLVALVIAVQPAPPSSAAAPNPASTEIVEATDVDDPLFRAPTDVKALISDVQASVVTIFCGESQGSGWVIDLGSPSSDASAEDLEIDREYPNEVITNHHVIEECIDDPTSVEALAGDETFDAYLYSWDADNDLALVAITQDVPALPVSTRPEPGWWAMAAGTPYGLEGSISIGNVMNLDGGDVISTAPLNFGNSGGPLVNSLGEVIGTNTAFMSPADDYQDWNIAIGLPTLCEAVVSCEDDEFGWAE